MDRLTVAGLGAFQPMEQYEYLENNCVEEPGKLCEFKKISGRILKTVDSVYQDVSSLIKMNFIKVNSRQMRHSQDNLVPYKNK